LFYNVNNGKRQIITIFINKTICFCIFQLNQQREEACREKDSMVMAFAQAEHKNLECLKRAERSEAKLREIEKERATFMEKMRIIKDQRSKMAAEVEAKVNKFFFLIPSLTSCFRAFT